MDTFTWNWIHLHSSFNLTGITYTTIDNVVTYVSNCSAVVGQSDQIGIDYVSIILELRIILKLIQPGNNND